MESVSESESDGGKEKFDVSSCVERVCAVLKVSGGYGVFVLDLKDHADAGADPVVNLFDPPRRAGFKRKNPNVLLQNFGFLCFCARDRVMCVFQGFYSVAHRETYYYSSCTDSEQQREMLFVYQLKLTEDVSKWRNRAIHKSKIDNGESVVLLSGCMHSSKVAPAAVQCHGYICVFSTVITYAGFSNIEASDFELYEPNFCSSISLPQLRVARRACAGSFQFLLLNDACQEQVLVPNSQCLTAAAEVARASFHITAFSVINHSTLVVQTDIYRCTIQYKSCIGADAVESI